MAGKTLDIRYMALTVVVPSLTPTTAPVSTNFVLGEVTLDSVDITIPIGHGALTGIAMEYDGVRLVPWSQTPDWIVGDDDRIPFDIGFDVAHPIVVKAYNLDLFSHTFYLRARVHEIRSRNMSGGSATVPLVL